MEILYGAILAFIIAILFAAIFSYGFKRRGPWGNFWSFFLILFLIIWVADIWVTPEAPQWVYWNNVAWFPLLMFGLIIALLLAAATPTHRPPKPGIEPETAPTEPEEAAIAIIGVFFWIMLIFLIGAIIAGLAT